MALATLPSASDRNIHLVRTQFLCDKIGDSTTEGMASHDDDHDDDDDEDNGGKTPKRIGKEIVCSALTMLIDIVCVCLVPLLFSIFSFRRRLFCVVAAISVLFSMLLLTGTYL